MSGASGYGRGGATNGQSQIGDFNPASRPQKPPQMNAMTRPPMPPFPKTNGSAGPVMNGLEGQTRPGQFMPPGNLPRPPMPGQFTGPPKPDFAPVSNVRPGFPPMPPRPQGPPSSTLRTSPAVNGPSNSPQFGLPPPTIAQPPPSMHPHPPPMSNTSSLQGSEPPSARSSRGPSPLPGTQYDAMEGQFTPSQTPQPGTPYSSNTPPKSTTPTSSPSTPSSQGQLPPRSGNQQNAFSPPTRPPAPQGPAGQTPLNRPLFPVNQVQTGSLDARSQQPSFLSQPGQVTPPGPFSNQAPPVPGQMPQTQPHPIGQTTPPMSVPTAMNAPGMQSVRAPGMPAAPGMPPMPAAPGVPPMSAAPGMPPMPTAPGMPSMSAATGMPPMPSRPPMPGMPPMPTTGPPIPGVQCPPGPPNPTASSGQGITGRRQYPKMAPGYQNTSAAPPFNPPGTNPPTSNQWADPSAPYGPPTSQAPPSYGSAGTYGNNGSPVAGMSRDFGRMTVQNYTLNLLQEKNLIPPTGVETPEPNLSNGYKKLNVSPDVFCSTLNAIPKDQSLLNKARLPLGILIHPFKDLSHLPVIQSSVIVRCKSCRTYINPFVTFLDKRRWKCNLCLRLNDAPEEFQFDPISKSYGDPLRRPEMKSSTIEFIAPSEYMLRPPQPAVYLFLLDVSSNAVETGYLSVFCETLLSHLDKLPGDARTQVGFITYDSCIHFYNLAEGLSQPQMMIVSDLDDVFLPSPDDLLVNLNENRDMVVDLLTTLPSQFSSTADTGNALGSALQAAHKLMSSTGGRITVMNTCLPNAGPGALKNRESSKDSKAPPLGPSTDFYKKLSLDCSGQQIAVDLFSLNGQYTDLATLSCASKYSGGSVQYYPSFHTAHNRGQLDRYEADLRRYLSRKIGFEAVMRIRCTRGLSITSFHGNFFVRSTDLLSLPNINPDAGFGMQMSIEDPLHDLNTACFQAALLYTSSKGERRIRVHTLCLPVTSQITEVIGSANQQAIASLLAKMAVERTLNASLRDSREAMINAATDAIAAYAATLPQAHKLGTVPAPSNLRLLPLYILALLKSTPFSMSQAIKLDERVQAMDECKTLPLCYLMKKFHPDLYPIHNLDREATVTRDDVSVPQPPLLQLSSANMDRHGAYLLDATHRFYIWVGAAVSDKFCQEVFNKPNFMSLPDVQVSLPELNNPTSELLRGFISHLLDQRPFFADLVIYKEDSRGRSDFLRYMIEDRTESSMSYYEFIQHLQKNLKS